MRTGSAIDTELGAHKLTSMICVILNLSISLTNTKKSRKFGKTEELVH